ncbi:TraV family lipoprotein [Novosphingobium percolationis]|uniref:TraV family lipoprotein n=1 Tax=Novosphingobium percolationis TaxID=2871811 RepID=UPI001CD74A42|nr:TraV family lipoprotein [Novosphingobium percolationis]
MAIIRTLAPVVLLLAGTGCTHLGTNIAGQFTCRAPKGDCAPSRVIDGKATAALAPETGTTAVPDDGLARARHRAGVTPGDAARTGERTLRVVFPAHVDEAGVLHDESVAWAVVEAPQWRGALRAASTPVDTSLIRTLRHQLSGAEPRGAAAGSGASDAPNDVVTDQSSASPFSIASPTVLPSTAAEASAGGPPPPVVEGSDMPAPQHDRAPRPNDAATPAPTLLSPTLAPPQIVFPTADAIDAAKARGAHTGEEHR